MQWHRGLRPRKSTGAGVALLSRPALGEEGPSLCMPPSTSSWVQGARGDSRGGATFRAISLQHSQKQGNEHLNWKLSTGFWSPGSWFQWLISLGVWAKLFTHLFIRLAVLKCLPCVLSSGDKEERWSKKPQSFGT